MLMTRNRLLITLALLTTVVLCLCSNASAGVRVGNSIARTSAHATSTGNGGVENGEPDIGQSGWPKPGSPYGSGTWVGLGTWREARVLKLASRILVARYLGVGF